MLRLALVGAVLAVAASASANLAHLGDDPVPSLPAEWLAETPVAETGVDLGDPCVNSTHAEGPSGILCPGAPAEQLLDPPADEPLPAPPVEENAAPRPEAPGQVPAAEEAIEPVAEAGPIAPVPETGHAEGDPQPEAVVPSWREVPVQPRTAAAQVPQRTGWTPALAAATVLLPTALLWKLASLAALRRRARKDPPMERRILDAVHAEPGIHHGELRRRVSAANGTLEHYLRRLLADGRLHRVQTPGYTCYVATGGAGADDVKARTALKSPTARGLLARLAGRDATVLTLAADAGLPLSTAHYHVAKLVKAGLVAADRSQRPLNLTLTPAGNDAAATLRRPNQRP